VSTAEALAAGRGAFARHDWERSYTAFREADAAQRLEPEDVERLADAARWTGRYDELLELLERAQAAYARRRDARGAARLALALARFCFEQSNDAAANGWWRRAARELESEPECAEHAHLQWMYAYTLFGAGDLDGALQETDKAVEMGRRLGEPDVEALALHYRGHTLITRGDVHEGLALVDEAMAVAMSGSVGLMAAGTVYCGTIWACRNVGDWRRASEWTDASTRWCERESLTRFPGLCRFHRAEVMRTRGALDEAERDAVAAAEELVVTSPRNAGWAYSELGEIRRRRGDLVGAAEAFRNALEVGYDPQPGLAMLRLGNGDAPGALRLVQRALDDSSGLAVESRPMMLPVAVRVAIEAGDLEAARQMHGELAAAARACGTLTHAAGEREAAGRVALAEGDADTAVAALREAVRLLCEIKTPYEAAHARIALAAAYKVLGDDYAATLELDAARATFDRLGAAADLAALTQAPTTQPREIRTFVFTDIVDSTRLVEVLGDDAWSDVLAWHDRTLRDLFAGHGGQEVDQTGDGFFAAFQDVAPALDFAGALQRALQQHRREHGFAPQVRVGIHAGEAVIRGENFGGRDVHVAARIGAASGPGEILVTAATMQGMTPGRSTSNPRTLSLKGVADPVDVVSLDWL
jgi:class 3 adenylate cyclase